ncbi:rhomboid family intramembrane serine protease GlpG [Shewanella eurypsychrophilus]|uniref:Rhomboid family intramembrane serine protease GlpG n=1 Tax=Shewanella eurypsychrophilus TaxID=2593656 RepID=A0ABX6V6E1_9GAMM|nr:MULTISPECIES: rhomboid family intramembrane serine protease GlpG [Shewanella]QFU20506.1 rhomboid family intramembrane serine protease GlpG [Shewanella sp. YLB-09]QFU20787.1 rhomboid family intramembrane serine protease GlpG [Shewanella sp. YLB-09]QPG56081.1 rhomboid family intramembrane serine protease GlpG [Shewanella eurypsychrophilus]
MIEIGKLPNNRAAQALIDYLKGQNIDCKIMPAEQGVSIVVMHDYNSLKASQEFEHFIQNPHDPKYLQASWDNGDSNLKLDYGAPVLQLFSQFITGAGPLTLGIMALCIAIFAGFNLGFADPIYQYLSFFNAVPGSGLSDFWRLFTPSLLHFSAMHIIFNLLWWWYLGGKIENKIGLTPLLTLLLVAGTLPNILQYFVAGPQFGGLSGVVYAVVGYTWIIGTKRPELGIGLPPAYMGFMLLWLVFGFTDMFGLSIANGAHVGGLLVGLAQGMIDSKRINR